MVNSLNSLQLFIVAYSNMGDSLERLNLADRAETVYKMALRQTGEGIKDQRNFQSGYSNSCFNLAKIQFERNDFNSSASTLELCMEAYRRFGKLAENRVLNLYGYSSPILSKHLQSLILSWQIIRTVFLESRETLSLLNYFKFSDFFECLRPFF